MLGGNFAFIIVFNNIQALKFKPQSTVYVFRCHQLSKRTSQETEVHNSQVKRSCLLVVTGRFDRFCLLRMFFCGSLTVTIIVIDGSKKHSRYLGFELQSCQ